MGCAILSRLEVLMCANREHLALRRHLESGIHTDSVIATHLLRIHASHAGADNDQQVNGESLYLQYFNQVIHFSGEHRMDDKVIEDVLVPLIRTIVK